MASRTIASTLLALSLAACGPGQASDGEEEGTTPTVAWSDCAAKDDGPQTCAEVCDDQGMTCAEAACPAEPEFCEPEPCDMATRVMGIGQGICEDPSVGGYFADACEAPIDWLFSNTVRCCCAQEN